MFSIMRKRREAERLKRLEDAFDKVDTNQSGRITKDQLIKLFSANEITSKKIV